MKRNGAIYWSPYKAKAVTDITHKQLQARSDNNDKEQGKKGGSLN
jgi:hypothetical protein